MTMAMTHGHMVTGPRVWSAPAASQERARQFSAIFQSDFAIQPGISDAGIGLAMK